MYKIERKWEFISNVLRKKYPVLSQLAKDIDGLMIKFYGFNSNTEEWINAYEEYNDTKNNSKLSNIFWIARSTEYCFACNDDLCENCLIYKKFGFCSDNKILQAFFFALDEYMENDKK